MVFGIELEQNTNMKLPKDIADLFNKSKPLSQEDLDQLKKAAEELDNDPEFMKEYQEDLQKELKRSVEYSKQSCIITL